MFWISNLPKAWSVSRQFPDCVSVERSCRRRAFAIKDGGLSAVDRASATQRIISYACRPAVSGDEHRWYFGASTTISRGERTCRRTQNSRTRANICVSASLCKDENNATNDTRRLTIATSTLSPTRQHPWVRRVDKYGGGGTVDCGERRGRCNTHVYIRADDVGTPKTQGKD